MQITYDSRHDLLYLRFDQRQQDVVNQRLSDDIVLDIGEDNKIIGIEILSASHNVDLSKLLPITYQAEAA